MKLKPNRNFILWAQLAPAVLLGAEALAADPGAASNTDAQRVFARVGEVVIDQREYDGEYAAASRNRFYHGKPPEAEVAVLQREIGDKLVTNALVLLEAKRLKLKPDEADVKLKLEQFEQRSANDERWQQVRERMLPALTRRYEEESLRNKLERQVRDGVPDPSEKQLRAYYDANPGKFTEPEQIRVSVILLSVDPAYPDFDTPHKRGEELVKQLRAGADFAEMASLYSGDAETVDQGGDMGYLHGGMVPELAQQVIGKLKPGEISDPTRMMEGVAIFKLMDRKEAELNSFDEVKSRARDLYLVEGRERAWKTFVAQLKKKTSIQVDESRYLPLPNAAPVKAVTGEDAAKN